MVVALDRENSNAEIKVEGTIRYGHEGMCVMKRRGRRRVR